MKVSQLITLLKKMPQNEDVGICMHDYDSGDSDNISGVHLVCDDEITNESGNIKHRVVICV